MPQIQERHAEKRLMNSFFAANMADLGITLHAVHNLGFIETNPLAADLFKQDASEYVSILKIAVTCSLLLLFALSKESNSRFAFSAEKSLQIGQFLVWLIVIFNTAQVLVEHVS